jgi:hypothetical protein
MVFINKRLLSLAILISAAFSANAASDPDFTNLPWMTGPLLAQAGQTLPAGHTNYEPYLFVTDTFGIYNQAGEKSRIPRIIKTTPTMVLIQGLTSFMDLQVIADYSFSNSSANNYSDLGDPTIYLGFQAFTENMQGWRPDLRVTISEKFPAGRYQNLNPINSGIDAVGAGSYQTGIGANFQKTYQFKNNKFLRARLTFLYVIPSSPSLNNVNTYGGGTGTSGILDLGNTLSIDGSLEFTLTTHWVPALDIVYAYQAKSKFTGALGTAITGMPATVGGQSSQAISLAPAMEYNFSPTLGIIAGAWFTVFGRNTADFAAAVFALNYYH